MKVLVPAAEPKDSSDTKCPWRKVSILGRHLPDKQKMANATGKNGGPVTSLLRSCPESPFTNQSDSSRTRASATGIKTRVGEKLPVAKDSTFVFPGWWGQGFNSWYFASSSHTQSLFCRWEHSQRKIKQTCPWFCSLPGTGPRFTLTLVPRFSMTTRATSPCHLPRSPARPRLLPAQHTDTGHTEHRCSYFIQVSLIGITSGGDRCLDSSFSWGEQGRKMENRPGIPGKGYLPKGRRVEMTSLASCSSVSAAKAAQSGLSMIAAWEEAGQRKKVRTWGHCRAGLSPQDHFTPHPQWLHAIPRKNLWPTDPPLERGLPSGRPQWGWLPRHPCTGVRRKTEQPAMPGRGGGEKVLEDWSREEQGGWVWVWVTTLLPEPLLSDVLVVRNMRAGVVNSPTCLCACVQEILLLGKPLVLQNHHLGENWVRERLFKIYNIVWQEQYQHHHQQKDSSWKRNIGLTLDNRCM